MDGLNLTRDDFASGLREQQERELAKFETQFVFTPFQPAAINALDAAIPEGRIVPIDPPERRAIAISLPEGANILRREGAEKSVAVYLDEVAPIVGLFLEIYRAEGAVVVPVLKGMSGRQFEKLGINRIVFGDAPLRTYRAYVARMTEIQARAKDDEPGRVMRGIADAVLYSVNVARAHAELVLQESHADMDSGKSGNPNAKRKYDRRDLRCIEFLEATPREQALNLVAQQQQQSTAAIPALLERIAAQEDRWMTIAEQMAAQTEALKAIAAGQVGGKGDGMPLNYDRLLSEIRDDLDRPDERAPADDTIMRTIGDVAQLLNLQAQNTGEGWSVAFFDLIVVANQPLYSFNEALYGKPVRVYTIDASDQNHVPRKVSLVDRQDVENYFDGRQVATSGHRWSAICMVPYWSGDQASIEVIPTPSQTATYRIWYETGEITEPTKGGTIPVQSPFHRYVRIKAASKLLGKCHWSRLLGPEPDKINPVDQMKMMGMHAERIRPDLVALEIEYAREYKEYIANMIQSGTEEAVPYGGWTEEW